MKRHTGGSEGKGRRIHVHEKGEAGEREKEEPTLSEEQPQPEPAEKAGAEVESLKAELEKASGEVDELKDKYLRLHAETDNFKKRMSRESAEREKYYTEEIIKELLPVLDNLERAITHAEENGEGEGGLVEGVRMVRKQLKDALGKFGVKEVESVGLPFDPEKQQAMMQVETDEYEEGVVIEEFQKGYFLHDRILRPAMVTVAKRPAAKEEEQGENDT